MCKLQGVYTANGRIGTLSAPEVMHGGLPERDGVRLARVQLKRELGYLFASHEFTLYFFASREQCGKLRSVTLRATHKTNEASQRIPCLRGKRSTELYWCIEAFVFILAQSQSQESLPGGGTV